MKKRQCVRPASNPQLQSADGVTTALRCAILRIAILRASHSTGAESTPISAHETGQKLA
jgi:hypothetical protein